MTAHHSYFAALEKAVNIARRELAVLMPTNGELGRVVEDAVRALLVKILPKRFSIGTGFIVDSAGNFSTQQDIVIYDNIYNAPILSEFSANIFPIECVYATVEVKATLTTVSLIEAMNGIGTVRAMQSTGRFYIKRDNETPGVVKGERRTIMPRAYIFGFSSPITPDTIAEVILSNIEPTHAHIHGAIVLKRDFYVHMEPHTNPVRLKIYRQNAFAEFFRSMLLGLVTSEMGEMFFWRYLGNPGDPPPAATTGKSAAKKKNKKKAKKKR